MLLGIGFFAFMIGHAMYKAGQKSDFLGLGLVVFGGLIRRTLKEVDPFLLVP